MKIENDNNIADNQDNTEYTKVRLIRNTDEFSMEYDYPCPSYIIIKDEGDA